MTDGSSRAAAALLAEDSWVRDRLLIDRASYFQLAVDLFAIVDFDGIFVQVNPAWTRHLGWAEEQTAARRFIDFVHEDDRGEVIAAFENLSDGQELEGLELRLRGRRGRYRTIVWTAIAEVDVRQSYMVGRDFTEQREAERSLRNGEARLRGILDAVADGVIALDPNDRVETTNPSCDRIFRAAPGTLVGRQVVELLPDFEGALVSSMPYERTAARVDGTRLPAEVSVTLSDIDGAPARILVVREISARKRSELERERLAAIIENTPDFVGLADTNGNLAWVNAGGSRMIGRSDDDPRNWSMLSLQAAAALIAEAIPAALAGDTCRCRSEREFRSTPSSGDRPRSERSRCVGESGRGSGPPSDH